MAKPLSLPEANIIEKATNGLLKSMVSGEGLANVYRGTGKVWVSPVAGTNGQHWHPVKQPPKKPPQPVDYWVPCSLLQS